MNKFSEQLLSAFEVAMDEKLSKLQYDKTIQAVINEVVDVDVGEYRVKYQDGIMSAYATDPAEVFKEGDLVYVTVPEGDFSNKKFISHKITNNSLSAGQYSQLADMIIDVSPEFQNLGFVYNAPSVDGYRLKIGISGELSIAESQSSDRFAAYAEKYEYIKIAASFKTEFTQEHTSGDYGIKVVFKDKQGVDIPYYLHVNDFNGDPYRLYTWSPQETVIKIPKGQIASLSSIRFFEKDFTSEGNTWNLFMKDLALTFVERVDMTDLPYYLNIIPIEGILFTSSITSISLVGQLIHYGDELPSSRCIYKWFERDLTIMPGVTGYDKRVGWGWKEIPNEVGNTLVRTKSQVPCEQSYKLLVVYNSDTIATKEITLYSAKLNVEIEQVNQNGTIVLKLTDNAYVGDWFYLTADGYQEAISDATHVNATGDVSGYLISSPMIFYCSVYKNNIYQGELTYVMQSIESKDDVSVVFSGEDIFTYDANGDINIYDSEYEKSLSAEIIWKKGVISSACTIRWLDYAGNVISTTARDYSGDSNMMFSSVRVDETGKILYYKIKPWLREVPSKNNTFQIEIATADGQRYIFEKQIIFTKTGDPGTNGSNYTSYIKITSTNKAVRDNQTQAVQLTCYVYKGQTLVSSGITVAWTLSNLTQVSVNNNVINVKANGTNKKRYVKATITVKESNKIVATLYDFYPVDTATVANTSLDTSLLPKYIKYSASGRNPTFLRRALSEVKYNGNVTTITSEDTATITIVGGYLRPVDEFIPTNPTGLLKIVSGSATFYHPIPMYINTFGNEAINNWDGVQVDLGGANDPHVFAPQVGAGGKDSNTNKFTGVIMGRDSGQDKIGLYGYKDGESTFGLLENGTAYFGKTGAGRIDINGTTGTITGGGGGTSANGMTIQLASTAATTKAIQVGNNNFYVTYGGLLNATGATISGTLTAGSGSKIGGWSLTDTRLYSGSGSNYVALDSGTANVNEAIWAGNGTSTSAKFRVTRAGVLTATDANLTGTITAKAGYIGWNSDSAKGWKIEANKISSNEGSGDGTKYVALSSNGTYAIWAGHTTNSSAPFSVTHAGKLKATSAEISGKITANEGRIGGWIINGTQLRMRLNSTDTTGAANIYLDGSNASTYMIYANNVFTVTRGGKLTATDAVIKGDITATTGSIGGWNIASGRLYASGTGRVGLAKSGVQGYLVTTSGSTNTNTNIGKFVIWTGAKYTEGAETSDTDSTDANGTESSLYFRGNSFFGVTTDGKMYCKAANVQGKVTADSGQIGNWYIKNSRLEDSTGNVVLGPSYVKLPGLTINNNRATFSGKVTADEGKIGSWNITKNGSLYSGSTYLNSDGTISGATISGSEIGGSKIVGGRYYDANENCLLYLSSDNNNQYYNLYFGPPADNPSLYNSKFGVRVLGNGNLELYLNSYNIIDVGLDSNNNLAVDCSYKWAFSNTKFSGKFVVGSGIYGPIGSRPSGSDYGQIYFATS